MPGIWESFSYSPVPRQAGTEAYPLRNPCRLCPHVAVVVGLVCFDDPWGYAVEPLMPDRSKVRFQFKRDTGGLRRARTDEVHFWDSSAHQTCLCKRTRDGVTAEEDLFKKGVLFFEGTFPLWAEFVIPMIFPADPKKKGVACAF